MSDTIEKIMELKKYLKKLQGTINREAVFTFFDVKIVHKKPVDDILCCIEASFPDKYKLYLKQYSPKDVQSYQMYLTLKNKIQNKFMFSSSHYSVSYNHIYTIITTISSTIESDMKMIEEKL